MHTAVIATAERPDIAADRAAIVSRVAAATFVAFVVLGASRHVAVSVNDQRTGTRRHAHDRIEGLRHLRSALAISRQ
jgi:hypothetical protein